MSSGDDRSASTKPEAATSDGRDHINGEEPMLYCPVCSQRLMPLKCKLMCERCGYYMSCADYY